MTLYEEQTNDSNDSYATKPELWRPIKQAVGGFDVDPASGAESEHIAETVYTKEDDGLQQEWKGNVWLNPPFSEKLPFFRKLVNELERGNITTAVALAPVDTSTQWFQSWYSQAELMCWLEGRSWYESTGSPPFNTVIGVFGEYNDELVTVLDRKGQLTKPVSTTTQTKL